MNRGRSSTDLLAGTLLRVLAANYNHRPALRKWFRENGVREVALLPYNPLWLEKSRKVGCASPFEAEKRMAAWMKPSELERCRGHFAGFEGL